MITVFCKWALSHFYLWSKWDFSQYFDGHCSLFRGPSQLTGNHIFSRQDRRCVTGRLLRTEEYLGWAAGLNLLLCSWCLQMRRSAAQPPATRASRQAVTLVTLQPPPMAAAHHQLSKPSPFRVRVLFSMSSILFISVPHNIWYSKRYLKATELYSITALAGRTGILTIWDSSHFLFKKYTF